MNMERLRKERSKVEAIVQALTVSDFAKNVSTRTVQLAIGTDCPFLKNYYAIADTYTYCITTISSLIANYSKIPETQVNSVIEDLIICFSEIFRLYHHAPLDVFSKIIKNRLPLYIGIAESCGASPDRFRIFEDAFYKILRYDFYMDEYYDVSAGEIPCVVTDFVESLSEDQNMHEWIRLYTERINNAMKNESDRQHSQVPPARPPVNNAKASSPSYSEKSQSESPQQKSYALPVLLLISLFLLLLLFIKFPKFF